eukprot:m.106090 g.106090  ORF g.106090 m.106090 type:complete len:878 (+) comp9167_c0_seq1:64-2697(+)
MESSDGATTRQLNPTPMDELKNEELEFELVNGVIKPVMVHDEEDFGMLSSSCPENEFFELDLDIIVPKAAIVIKPQERHSSYDPEPPAKPVRRQSRVSDAKSSHDKKSLSRGLSQNFILYLTGDIAGESVDDAASPVKGVSSNAVESGVIDIDDVKNADDPSEKFDSAVNSMIDEATLKAKVAIDHNLPQKLVRSISAQKLVGRESLSEFEQAHHDNIKQELINYKDKLRAQSEANYMLEQKMLEIDQKIGLLITHRLTVEETDTKQIDFLSLRQEAEDRKVLTDRARRLYGHLFHVLRRHPKYLATLARSLGKAEMDDFLHTVMFTLFGNHTDPREEHLLLSIFEHALRMEFESTADLGSLMRSNTAMSRMMTTYTRRGSGQSYLKNTLLPPIQFLLENEDVVLEINPLKIYTELAKNDKSMRPAAGVTAQEAVQIPEVKAIMDKRFAFLERVTDNFLDAIISSVNHVPYGVRWLSRIIGKLTRRRFPDAPNETIVSLIGGFYLLRFVNPAIISPDAYNIINDRPSTEARAGLTLVAKIIQSIANNTAFSKDMVVDTLNNYVADRGPKLRAFLTSLCEVDDFFEDHKLGNIAELAHLRKSIIITPNEIFTIHRLLNKYEEKLKLSDTDRLGLLLDQLGESPEALSRIDNHPLTLDLIRNISLPERSASFCSNFSGFSDRQAFNEAKKLGLTEKARRQLATELQVAKRAYAEMCENYAFLKAKLDTYETYLENVRGQAISINSLRTDCVSIDTATRPSSRLQAKRKKFEAHKGLGPFHFRMSQLDKEGIVLEYSHFFCAPGEPGRNSIIVTFSMPKPGSLVFSVGHRGRQALYHNQANLDEILLSLDSGANPIISLGEFVTLDARKILCLLDSTIFK